MMNKMPEYIERNAVLDKSAPIPGYFCDMISAWDVVNIPAADVAPVVHGKWNDNKYGLCFCSVCGYPPSYVPAHCFASSFCPKCGSKMDMKD